MSRYNHYQKFKPRDIIFLALGTVLTIVVLALGLPKKGYTKYLYHIGEPWEEDPIIAQDSFPVFKSDEQMAQERDSLRRYYEPYFRIDAEMASVQIDSFTRQFGHERQEGMTKQWKSRLTEKLAFIYGHGIISVEDRERLAGDHTLNVRLFCQNTAKTQPMEELFTEKTAYEYLMETDDSTHQDYDRLAQYNLGRFVKVNLTYDEEKSKQQKREVDDLLVPYMGQVLSGQKIVDKGQIVDEYIYHELRSMEQHYQQQSKSTPELLSIMGGKVLLLTLLVTLLLVYFIQFRTDFLLTFKNMLFVMVMYLTFPFLTFRLVEHDLMSVFIIPYCILPVFLRVFMDSRTAFTTHTITILTCAIALQHPFEFLLIQSVAGLMAIYSLKQLQQRSDLFRAILIVTGAVLLTQLSIDMSQENFFKPEGLDTWNYIYLAIAGAFSLIAYLLLIPIERIFKFTSAVTLVELSNVNNPLLRRLSEEAPGTFQHSMQVANLAAEVANRLGARSLLVRTGALYHDIGKIENPVFFTENQNGVNPHNALSCEESASIIIRHVRDGVRLAGKYGIPQIIQEFIVTHHGRSMTKYFVRTFRNEHPDCEIDESKFTYPGPNPGTMEQAILMMADTLEAASRSLTEYNDENINNLVESLIDNQVKEGCFNECSIMLRDISTAKEVFKAKLKTIYHTRIKYPEKENGIPSTGDLHRNTALQTDKRAD